LNFKVALLLGKKKKLAEGRSGEWDDHSSVVMACFAGYFFARSDQ
jgi:hypothetical protein